MLLVHVVAGNDPIVRLSEFDVGIRIVLEVDSGRLFVQGEDAEHFAVDLKHKAGFVKRQAFTGMGKAEGQVSESFVIHRRNLRE